MRNFKDLNEEELKKINDQVEKYSRDVKQSHPQLSDEECEAVAALFVFRDNDLLVGDPQAVFCGRKSPLENHDLKIGTPDNHDLNVKGVVRR